MLKMSYACCPGPSPAISLLKCELQPKIAKKLTKTPILGVQGHRCWHQKSLWLLLVIFTLNEPIEVDRELTTFYGGSRLWCPPAPASLNLGGRDLDCQIPRLMLKISYTGCLGLSSHFVARVPLFDALVWGEPKDPGAQKFVTKN